MGSWTSLLAFQCHCVLSCERFSTVSKHHLIGLLWAFSGVPWKVLSRCPVCALFFASWVFQNLNILKCLPSKENQSLCGPAPRHNDPTTIASFICSNVAKSLCMLYLIPSLHFILPILPISLRSPVSDRNVADQMDALLPSSYLTLPQNVCGFGAYALML